MLYFCWILKRFGSINATSQGFIFIFNIYTHEKNLDSSFVLLIQCLNNLKIVQYKAISNFKITVMSYWDS